MRKLKRLILQFFLLLLIIGIGMIVFNFVNFNSRQISGINPIDETYVDDLALERLSDAIKINTASLREKIDTQQFLLLDSLMMASFPNVYKELNVISVNQFSKVLKWKGRDSQLKPVLLLAHLDVVPVDTNAMLHWQQNPFSGAIINDTIWGRGTLDDKISAFGILEASEQLLKENYFPERDIYFAFGHDEEISGLRGAKEIAKLFKSKNLEFEYVLDEGTLVLNDAMPGLSKPLALIGIAEKGYVTLNLNVELDEGGHSSMPGKETAIGIISKAINNLQENPFPARIDGASAELFAHVGPEMSPLFKTLFSNMWLFESVLINQLGNISTSNAMIRTTTAPTIISGGFKENVLPTTVNAKVNFRILPGETKESVVNYVKNIIDDQRVSITQIPGGSDPSKVSSTESFGYRVLERSIKEIFPETIICPSLVVAGTDSRHYQEVSENILRFLPIQLEKSDLTRIHGYNECIPISGYKKAIRFYYQLIKNSSK